MGGTVPPLNQRRSIMKKRNLLKTLLAATLICASVAYAGAGIAVKGNPDSKIYHKPVCKHYSGKGSTAEFKSEADAIKAGYTACKQCGKATASDKSTKKK